MRFVALDVQSFLSVVALLLLLVRKLNVKKMLRRENTLLHFG